ncbi:membrane protein [Thermocladium modestius]|uniref:Membrane protein n=1 Tax=Thermocladium modestius TaxID=62609 RepID=A0A830GV73_9CREN|nr:carotenoid biosynthesis protein [Thermocladium modestius]GGP19880.1 membrane protein [Thermocladium modestius]
MDKLTVVWTATFLYVPFLLLSYIHLPRAVGSVIGLLGSPIYLIAAYLLNSITVMGARRSIVFLAISSSVSFLFEFVGVHYGVPFGSYRYTAAMGPELLGVPFFIPLLWASLGYFSLMASGNYYAAAVGMVALDAGFDPLLSGPLGLWKWRGGGQYFGVPLTNFAGWLVVSLIIYLLFKASTRYRPKPSAAGLLFYISYYATWILAAFMLGLPKVGLASITLLATYSAVIGALLATRGRRGPSRQANGQST